MTDPAIEAAARALRDKVGSATFAGRSNLLPLSLDDLAKTVLTAVTPLIRAAALEEAAKVADKEAATYDALIEQGKGEHGKPGYVRDDTWNSWLGKYSIAMSIASDVRALKEQP
jgi:dihydroxyacetone kinase